MKKRKRKASSVGDGQEEGLETTTNAKSTRIWREVAPSKPIDDGFHTYKADPLDHAETDIRAYEHVKPLLTLVGHHLSKKISNLALWDPYYCKGAMVERLAKLGFNKVHNKNEDFYAVIASGKLPEHDVIISSPPYSGDHLEKCIKFCHSSKKVWCMLLPNWVESRPYFKSILGEEANRVFYISPTKRFTYWMPLDLVKGRSKPEWVGQDGGTSPYNSTWFIYLPHRFPQKKIFAALERLPANGRDWVLAQTLKAARWKLKKQTQEAPPVGGPEGLGNSQSLKAVFEREGRNSQQPSSSKKEGKKRRKGSGPGRTEGQRFVMPGTVTFD